MPNFTLKNKRLQRRSADGQNLSLFKTKYKIMEYRLEDEDGNVFAYTREDIKHLVKGDEIKKGYENYYTVDYKLVDLDEHVTTVFVKKHT